MAPLSAALSASASALAAEKTRIEAAVSNLANAESTRGPNGAPYRRRDVVLASAPVSPFGSLLDRTAAVGVNVVDVVEDQAPFRRRYEPAHPDADASGYVALPNVDQAEEMVNMLGAARAYQANLAAIGLIREVLQRSLELGK